MSYPDILARGGMMMWPILVCLFIVLYVIVDRILAYRRVEADSGAFVARLRNLVRRGEVNGVLAMCDERRTGLALMVHDAMSRRAEGEERLREVMEKTQQTEAFRLERRLPLLGLAAAIAPMLGFLGTLLGLIVAFRAVEIHPMLGGSGILAGRIWSALLPSALGLAVGIPAYAVHGYFVSRARDAVRSLELAKADVFDLLNEPVHAAPLRSEDHRERTTKRVLSYEEDEFFRRKAESKTQ